MPLKAIFERIRAKTRFSENEREAHPSRAQGNDANTPTISFSKPQETTLRSPPNNQRDTINASRTYYRDKNDEREHYKAPSHPSTIQEITSKIRHLELSLNALQALPKGYQQVGAEAKNQNQYNAASNFHPTLGPFANASGFVINGQVNMVDTVHSNQPVLQRLIEKGNPGAIHNSDYREYPPRCCENTRVSLRNDVLQWYGKPNRQHRLLWYTGSAGIGKSAIAQSVAEELEKTGHLGGTFFFSRPGQINDPATVIPTLAYQLAMRNSVYKQIISQRLVDDLLILNKNRSTQFNKLIIEPFQIIATASDISLQDPLLIILDGLDECKGTEAQCELVQLLLDHAGRIKQFPLLWLIYSRPEWHFRTMVSDVDFPAACEKKEISVDDAEAQADARRLLEGELVKIQKQFESFLSADWPPRQDVDRLCKAASGHLGYASFMTRFIGDKEVGDPEKQLRICNRIASGLGVDEGTRVNPLEALDRLYSRVLSDVPAAVLPVTMQILSTSQNPFDGARPVQDQADFLLLTQASYYGALRSLHSVLDVPLPSEASSRNLRFYHASFADFLSDPARSGKFQIAKGTEFLDSAVRSFRWLGKHNNTTSNVNAQILRFARWWPWQAPFSLQREHLKAFISEMESFDFEKLQDPYPTAFVRFIRWLGTKAPPNKLLVRLINKPPEGAFRTLSVEYEADTEPLDDWVSDFFPNNKPKQSPLVLHFLLGLSSRLHVHLTVHEKGQS